MTVFTQKYTIVHLLKDLPDGFEYSMKEWPLHVTLADVFAIDGAWRDLLRDLELSLVNQKAPLARVEGEDYFGEDKSVHVKLLEKTHELQNLHDTIVRVLETYNVTFNSPQYTKSGFIPHSTEQKDGGLKIGDMVKFNSVTLIDMFPGGDPYQRRILGTIQYPPVIAPAGAYEDL